MRDFNKGHLAPTPRLGKEAEIPEEQWDQVAGGTPSTAGGRGSKVGSQSTGAGAGKITFNPFSED